MLRLSVGAQENPPGTQMIGSWGKELRPFHARPLYINFIAECFTIRPGDFVVRFSSAFQLDPNPFNNDIPAWGNWEGNR